MSKPHARVNDKHGAPYWRRAHHDWRFWVAMALMTAAISTYVMTQDLRFVHGDRVAPGLRPGSGAPSTRRADP